MDCFFSFHLWRCCNLKVVSRVKSPSKSMEKINGGVQRKHELCPTTWYLWLQTSCFFCVVATMSILFMFSCLPYQSMLHCYTTGNKYLYIYIIYVWEYCNIVTKNDTPKYSFTASYSFQVGVWADVGRLINKFSLLADWVSWVSKHPMQAGYVNLYMTLLHDC